MYRGIHSYTKPRPLNLGKRWSMSKTFLKIKTSRSFIFLRGGCVGGLGSRRVSVYGFIGLRESHRCIQLLFIHFFKLHVLSATACPSYSKTL